MSIELTEILTPEAAQSRFNASQSQYASVEVDLERDFELSSLTNRILTFIETKHAYLGAGFDEEGVISEIDRSSLSSFVETAPIAIANRLSLPLCQSLRRFDSTYFDWTALSITPRLALLVISAAIRTFIFFPVYVIVTLLCILGTATLALPAYLHFTKPKPDSAPAEDLPVPMLVTDPYGRTYSNVVEE
ncbi:MAG: hypothetical protein HYX48_05365 [Chlamydiales bacterium]|nr:hypothetical protein [Chlamydiales bacterium]